MFLPLTFEEMEQRGWKEPDIVVVTGDSYMDHPAFGTAVISRVLEKNGFKVCIVAQPQKPSDFTVFGCPRLAFFVSSGNIDSMVAHYTAAKKPRSDDYYTAGGKSGMRPDRAVNVYVKMIKEVFPEVPVAIGGLEASLRRFAHYDYWDNRVRPSSLIDSGADLLMFGMGERQSVEIAKLLKKGRPVSTIRNIPGILYKIPENKLKLTDFVECPSFDEVSRTDFEGKKKYAESCRIQQDEFDAVRGKTVVQKHGEYYVVQNPPSPPLTTEELDEVYELPYERNYHPSYEKLGGVPGITEVKFSITHNRGCFGACNFCSLAYHQGRMVSARSEESVIREAIKLTEMKDFKGYIHDVGGPTADFTHHSCKKQAEQGLCKGKKCLAPTPCKMLVSDHTAYLSLLRKLRKLPKVKKVFIRSGIRFDYVLQDKKDTFFKELVEHHISGQLKVAPEHCSPGVLRRMGKPDIETYMKFKKKFFELTEKAGKKQYLVPYLMSSHPGSTINDAIELAIFLRNEGLKPQQVQDFYPTPGTVSTCMFYTGLDPYTMEKVYVPKTQQEKSEQRALLQYFLPENRERVINALKKAGREDLIGNRPGCLIKTGKPINTQSDKRKNTHIKKGNHKKGKRK